MQANAAPCSCFVAASGTPPKPDGKFPTPKSSYPACHVGRRWIESEEFNDAAPVGFRRAVLVLLPFFDRRVADSNCQHFGQFWL